MTIIITAITTITVRITVATLKSSLSIPYGQASESAPRSSLRGADVVRQALASSSTLHLPSIRAKVPVSSSHISPIKGNY